MTRLYQWRGTILILILLVVTGAFAYREYQHRHEPAPVMTPGEVRDPVAVAKQLDVPPAAASQIVHEIRVVTQREPAAVYQVQAPTPAAAVPVVERQIERGDVPVALPPADKTVVSPQQQQVDVYRISLDKPRGAGVYVSSESAGAMVQYNHIIGFGGPRYRGGYEVGVGYLVRW